ncbi:leucine-rich repeat extensin-like protein 3 [Penaeus chinensis]|uniref:leucine-rich repeat extensin-like protein 3 n=1 Tax=Penaeus chinensis TaxID=139456 RepID=UPI001FB68E3A|nr:leucine-rich repeat extensin-like protein 3 [Penaeus chinensis]
MDFAYDLAARTPAPGASPPPPPPPGGLTYRKREKKNLPFSQDICLFGQIPEGFAIHRKPNYCARAGLSCSRTISWNLLTKNPSNPSSLLDPPKTLPPSLDPAPSAPRPPERPPTRFHHGPARRLCPALASGDKSDRRQRLQPPAAADTARPSPEQNPPPSPPSAKP